MFFFLCLEFVTAFGVRVGVRTVEVEQVEEVVGVGAVWEWKFGKRSWFWKTEVRVRTS